MSRSTTVKCDRCGNEDHCDPNGGAPVPPKDWGSFSMSFRGKTDIEHDLCPSCVASTAGALATVQKP